MARTAQQIREEISANRQAWHATRDKKKQDALHAATVGLYGELDGLEGTTSTYDPNTGVWTTTKAGVGDYVGKALPQPTDRSREVRELQEAATERTVAGLNRAKNQALRALDREEGALGAGYQAARNQTAAQNQIERRGFQEKALDSGLGSGAAAQAELSQSVAAQSELGAITRAEQEARRDIEARRGEMEADYAYAVEEARAEGDYALAEALREEAARYEEAQLQRDKAQEGLDRAVYESARENREREQELIYRRERDDYEEAQDAYERAREAEATAYERAQDARELAYKERRDALDRSADAYADRRAEAVKLAQARASYGDFQGYAKLGYTQAEIAKMAALWWYYDAAR